MRAGVVGALLQRVARRIAVRCDVSVALALSRLWSDSFLTDVVASSFSAGKSNQAILTLVAHLSSIPQYNCYYYY